MAAVGSKAPWLTADHPLQYGYGRGSPFAKLIEARGEVLLLGAPPDTVTLLHHAEHVARVPNKRVARYRQPVLRDGVCRWIEVEEFDTSSGIREWRKEDGNYFRAIVEDYLRLGHGARGTVGAATAYLLDAEGLNDHAVTWLEREFAV